MLQTFYYIRSSNFDGYKKLVHSSINQEMVVIFSIFYAIIKKDIVLIF